MTGATRRWPLHDPAAAGLYRIDHAAAAALCEEARAAGLRCARIDLAGFRGKADLLRAMAQALEFPAWFGHNWDALADCLDDLEWLRGKGYVLLLEHPAGLSAAAPKDFALALDILADAAHKWNERGTPFWVFLTSPPRGPCPKTHEDHE